MGMSKHRKSGTVHTADHFTGRQGEKRTRRKSTTKKQRKLNRGSHINKYKE